MINFDYDVLRLPLADGRKIIVMDEGVFIKVLLMLKKAEHNKEKLSSLTTDEFIEEIGLVPPNVSSRTYQALKRSHLDHKYMHCILNLEMDKIYFRNVGEKGKEEIVKQVERYLSGDRPTPIPPTPENTPPSREEEERGGQNDI